MQVLLSNFLQIEIFVFAQWYGTRTHWPRQEMLVHDYCGVATLVPITLPLMFDAKSLLYVQRDAMRAVTSFDNFNLPNLDPNSLASQVLRTGSVFRGAVTSVPRDQLEDDKRNDPKDLSGGAKQGYAPRQSSKSPQAAIHIPLEIVITEYDASLSTCLGTITTSAKHLYFKTILSSFLTLWKWRCFEYLWPSQQHCGV